MKSSSKIVLSAFTLVIVFSLVSSGNVNANGAPDQIVEVSGDSIQTQVQSQVRTTFRFREKTQLTIYANVEINLNLDCETKKIAAKDFFLEIEGENNLQMNMICTREETQLGLMDGNTYRVRNRNTYRYRERFCISIECEAPCDCQCECVSECQCVCNCEDKETFNRARLRIRATNENRNGKWAYYDENSKEWVTVPTTVEEGYLTADTDHFSTWTVLIPTISSNLNLLLIIGSSTTIAFIGVIIGTSFLYLKKRS